MYLYTDLVYKLLQEEVSKMALQYFIDLYGEPLPQAISDVCKAQWIYVGHCTLAIMYVWIWNMGLGKLYKYFLIFLGPS